MFFTSYWFPINNQSNSYSVTRYSLKPPPISDQGASNHISILLLPYIYLRQPLVFTSYWLPINNQSNSYPVTCFQSKGTQITSQFFDSLTSTRDTLWFSVDGQNSFFHPRPVVTKLFSNGVGVIYGKSWPNINLIDYWLVINNWWKPKGVSDRYKGVEELRSNLRPPCSDVVGVINERM